MILKLYCVFDSASGIYDGPSPMMAHGQAIREFSDRCVRADSVMGQHPEDFSLVYLGEFNNETGEIKTEARVTLITGEEAVASSRNVEPIVRRAKGE